MGAKINGTLLQKQAYLEFIQPSNFGFSQDRIKALYMKR
jgi:hypothetical protein